MHVHVHVYLADLTNGMMRRGIAAIAESHHTGDPQSQLALGPNLRHGRGVTHALPTTTRAKNHPDINPSPNRVRQVTHEPDTDLRLDAPPTRPDLRR